MPFPSHEVIGCLPQCREVMLGVLGADLVAFHTFAYLRHFRSALLRLTGVGSEMDHVDHDGHRARLRVLPIGVDKVGLDAALRGPECREHLDRFAREFDGKALVLSVERLDYSKVGDLSSYLLLLANTNTTTARS